MTHDRFDGRVDGGPDDSPGPSLEGSLRWLAIGAGVLVVAVLAGLATAYIVATLRAAPPPQSVLVTPSPIPSPTAQPTPPAAQSPSPPASPSASPSIELSPSPDATPLVHIVQRGESISLIAAEYGTTAQAIIELNQLRNPNVIYVGQRLLIPPPSP